MNLQLGQIADILHAEGDPDPSLPITGYSIDSRTVAAGDLFFAVRGERVDGHDYVEAALKNGAAAAVVSQRWLASASVDNARLLRLPDTASDCVLGALQTLANAVRKLWGKRVIGITGSAGKTTTKECVAAVLEARFRVLKTEGNLNNHFGLPLQLLRLEPEHDIAVLEMGMNHAGEIAALARIAEPDWAVISNVAEVHTEFFEDGIEGVARAKKELVDALPPEGIAFLNADDPRVSRFGEGRKIGAASSAPTPEGAGMAMRSVLYGTAANAVVRAVEIEEFGLAGTRFLVRVTPARATREIPHQIAQHSVQLSLLGRHNILNALAAVAVGLAAGIPLPVGCEALEALRPTEKRGAVLDFNGAQIINDCYNSNPHALNAMVATLAATPLPAPGGRRILVAGEMLELGPQGPLLHSECGRAAAQAGLDVVAGVRGLAEGLARSAGEAGAEALFFQDAEDAGRWLRLELRAGDLVLLKGSRGVRLERALEALRGPSVVAAEPTEAVPR